ncbi:hypothetical protein BGZ58_000860 [Dissophora ornata]|nr:hypothetical protein BGZ58_000860 [Dissophora ornata]
MAQSAAESETYNEALLSSSYMTALPHLPTSTAPTTLPPADLRVTASDNSLNMNGAPDQSSEISSEAFITAALGLQQPTPPHSNSSSSSTDNDVSSIKLGDLATTPPPPEDLTSNSTTTATTASAAPKVTAAEAPVPQRLNLDADIVPSGSPVSSRGSSPASPTAAMSVSDSGGEGMQSGHTNGTLSQAETTFLEGQKNRFTFTDTHNTALEKVFETQQYPSKTIKIQLSEHLGCTEVQVKNWFSRRRTRAALEQQEKKEKQAMLEKLDKKPARTPSAASDSHAGVSDEKDSLESLLGEALFGKLTGAVTKAESRETRVAADTKNGAITVTRPLKSSEIGLMISRITRGNSFVKSDDIDTAVELMQAAVDYDGRKYIMNALLFTKSQPILRTFMRSEGPGIFRTWMIEAKKDADSSNNKDLLQKAIAILKTLPFDVECIKRHKLGRVIKLLANDKDIDREISHQAFEVMEKWRELIETSATSSGPSSDTRPDGANKGRKRDRDNDLQGLHHGSDAPLPKFVKGKSATPVETIKKSNIVENAGFFKELMAGPPAPSKASTLPPIPTSKSVSSAPSPSPSSTSSSPKSSTFPPSIATATEMSPSSENGITSSPTTPNAAETSVRSEPQIESTTALSSQSASSTDILQGILNSLTSATSNSSSGSTPTAGPMEWNPSNSESASDSAATSTSTPTSRKKKVVRFKADHELVDIQLIESRWDILEYENENANANANGGDMAHGYEDSNGIYDEDSMMFDGSLNRDQLPTFMMNEQRLETLVRGDIWRPPMLLLLDNNTERGSKSTEKDVQEKREMETLSVYYRQLAYIPSSPAEPDPEPEQPGATPAQSGQPPASSNTAAVLAALSAAVAASNASQPVNVNTTNPSAALLNSLAAASSALNPGYNAYAQQPQQQAQQYQPQTSLSYAGLYGSFGTGYAQPTQYQNLYQPQTAQVTSSSTPTTTAAVSNGEATQATERARALLDMLQQTTQQQQQQQAYYAAYQQALQQSQSQQQQQQQSQQSQQQQQAFDYSSYYQNYQSRS